MAARSSAAARSVANRGLSMTTPISVFSRAELSATGVPFFSLVGAPRPEQVSPVLGLTYKELSRMDPRNDSQLLASDAVVPSGALLGYVNADHWAIAMPLLQRFPSLYGVFHDEVPRAALVAAAIEVVAQALGTAAIPKP